MYFFLIAPFFWDRNTSEFPRIILDLMMVVRDNVYRKTSVADKRPYVVAASPVIHVIFYYKTINQRDK